MGCYSVNQLLTVVSRRDFDNVFYLPFKARGENGRGMRLFMHLFTQSVFVKDSYIVSRRSAFVSYFSPISFGATSSHRIWIMNIYSFLMKARRNQFIFIEKKFT